MRITLTLHPRIETGLVATITRGEDFIDEVVFARGGSRFSNVTDFNQWAQEYALLVGKTFVDSKLTPGAIGVFREWSQDV